jgi:microsomal dipeptidase-like Zn-dependent dipeptidase
MVSLKVPVRLSLTLLGALLAAVPAHAAPVDDAVSRLANGCYAVTSASGATPAGPYRFKATMWGRFLLMGPDGKLLGTGGGLETAGPAAEWSVARATGSAAFRLAQTEGGGADTVTLAASAGCADVPEAEVGATGPAVPSRNADGTVRGIADTHLHLTGDMRAGGMVMGGEPFDRFGIVKALGQDAAEHGADGSLDVTGNLLRDGVPFGTHDTGGWPTFAGWPVNDTNTHEQIYYKWLERAWRGGLRLVVAETVEDAELCKVEPRRKYSCDETTAIRGQIARLRELQDYVDAQSGGAGRGWFRLVRDPAAARRAIGAGQLAVVIGVESSFPLNCHGGNDVPHCTTRQLDYRLDQLYAAGVRSLFVAHWADNGFAGAAVEGGVKGKFINALARVETGHWFSEGTCPDPSQGEVLQALSPLEVDVLSGFFPATKLLKNVKAPKYSKQKRCNPRGLTALGRHLVTRMMDKGMLIELDHMSERAREDVLKLAQKRHYPGVVSGHSDTGGHWTTSELRRLTALGGVASQRLDQPAALAKAIDARTRYGAKGVGLGTDVGGFSTLPSKAALAYPFRIGGAGPEFARQVTGQRTFDLNADGMAHYGLLPDLLAATAQAPGGAKALGLLERSAETYLCMWAAARKA